VYVASQDTLGAAPATEIKLEDHCPYKYERVHISPVCTSCKHL